MISLPLAANLAGVDGGDPGAENRELAPFPHARRIAGVDRALPAAFSRWFDDHFGFRSTAGALVRREPAVRARRVAVGGGRQRRATAGSSTATTSDRGLRATRADDRRERSRTGARRSPRARLAARARHRLRLHHRARQARRSTPRRCPPTLARVGDLSRDRSAVHGACRTPGSPSTCAPALFEAKARERVYQQTDTHWNDRGALVAYQQIIDAVRAARAGDAAGVDARRLRRRSTATIEGLDLAGMMGLTRVLREEDLTLVPKRPRRARVVEPAGARADRRRGTARHRDRRLVAAARGDLPRLVRVAAGAVSVGALQPRGLSVAERFRRRRVTKEHPDVVIQEIVGRHLYNFIPSPELVPK